MGKEQNDCVAIAKEPFAEMLSKRGKVAAWVISREPWHVHFANQNPKKREK